MMDNIYFYYTKEDFDLEKFERIKLHANNALKGVQNWPRLSTSVYNSDEALIIILSDVLLKCIINNPKKKLKPYEVTLKYGFRGYSSGKKNGIFLQRKQDDNLLKETNRLIENYSLFINEWIGDSYKPVKIVYHDTRGERVIGIMNFETHRVFFMDFAKY